MGAELDGKARLAIAYARATAAYHHDAEVRLGKAVHMALRDGVPILTLANALGVSRSRIRRLAR